MNELIARITDWWQTLSPRERILVGFAGAATLLSLFVVGLVQPVLAVANGIDARAEVAEQQLDAMNRLRREYDVVNASLGAVEDQIRANPQKRNLLTLLESLASRSSVKINSMEERKAQEDEKFKETRVEVRLKRVTLEAAVSYLHAIEASDQLLTVKSLKMKNRTDRSNLLDVTFNVSTFETL
jgi:type II secretory pathway component PulM